MKTVYVTIYYYEGMIEGVETFDTLAGTNRRVEHLGAYDKARDEGVKVFPTSLNEFAKAA